jgi:hypothetical protein
MQHKIKNLFTKKLFYKKWLYKVVVSCPGIGQLRRRGLEYITTVQTKKTGNFYLNSIIDDINNHRKDLILISSILEKELKSVDHQVRVEGSSCAIFTNSKSLISNIEKALHGFVTEIHLPESLESEMFLSGSKNKVICSQLPLEGYRYKIYLKNGDIRSYENLQKFVSWADNFKDRIHIPIGTRRVLVGLAHPYIYGQYFYAKDQKMASMALMIMGDHLNKTEEYVLKSELI